MQGSYLGKIISCTEKKFPRDVYNALKKSYTFICQKKNISNSRGLGRKFLPKLNHPYPLPDKIQMGNHIGGGEEAGGFDTLVDVIRQQNGWHAFIMWYPASRGPSIFPTYLGRSKGLCSQGNHVVVFRTKVLHFKIENTPIKDISGKRKFKRVLRFLFVDML